MKFRLFFAIVILATIHQSFSMTPHVQQNLNDQLVEAARQGNNTKVDYLLQAGAHINARDNGGMTPLHWAALNGDLILVRVLLAHGADINAKDVAGNTPLHFAVFNGHTPTVELLKAYQALLEQAKKPTKKFLEIAIEHGYYGLVKLCLQRGLKPGVDDLLFAKEKWQTAQFKQSYQAIGRLLVAYFKLIGELKSPEDSENSQAMSYLKKLMAYFRLRKPEGSMQGPISKTGIVGLYGLPESIAQNIATFIN